MSEGLVQRKTRNVQDAKPDQDGDTNKKLSDAGMFRFTSKSGDEIVSLEVRWNQDGGLDPLHS